MCSSETLTFLEMLFEPYRGVIGCDGLHLGLRMLAPEAQIASWRAEGWSEAQIRLEQVQPLSFCLTDAGLAAAAKQALWSAKRRDVYCEVLPHRVGDRTKQGKVWGGWLWCEIDGKDEGVRGAQTRLAGALSEGVPIPTIEVISGGGLHLYWRLQESVALGEAERIPPFESALRRLARVIGGVEWDRDRWGRPTGKLKSVDVQQSFADPSCCEVARILRVPGTFNHKPDRQCAVRLVAVRPEAPVWSYDRWRAWLPCEPRAPVKPWRNRATNPVPDGGVRPLPAKTLRDLQTRFPEGQKYEAILKILHTARCCGFDEGVLQILADRFILNHQCERGQVDKLVRATMRNIQPT